MAKKERKNAKRDKRPIAKKVAAKDTGELTEDQLTAVAGGVTGRGRVFPKVESELLTKPVYDELALDGSGKDPFRTVKLIR